MDILLGYHGVLLQGLATTLVVSASAIAIGLIAGLLLAFGLMSPYRVVRWPCGVYRSFWRGTPILLQLLLVYYLLPEIGVDVPPVIAAILALAMNTTAFQAEIFRSGLAHVPSGQSEAARMLGMNRWTIRRRILIPQMFRLILPPLTNEVITILKNSSLVSVIAVTELMRVSQQISAQTFDPLATYLAAGAIYLTVNLLMAQVSRQLERRWTGAIAE